jgi:hypothetical protein
VAISRLVFSNLRKTLLMPGEMSAHEDIGDLADARIQKTFTLQEAEGALEEISEVEEIRVVPASAPTEVAAKVAAEAVRSPEVELEPTSLRKAEASPSAPAELEEIEVEVPEPPPAPPPVAPAPPPPAVSVEVEEGGLTFLKFEAPFVTPGGHAVLPALFLDAAGNPVRLRIRISMEEEPR